MITDTVRNRVWTSDDLRTLRSALNTARSVKEAAKQLDRDAAEVRGMAADLGWIDSPPLAPDGTTSVQSTAAARYSSACHEAGHAIVGWSFGLAIGQLKAGVDGDDWAGKAEIAHANHLPVIDQLAICVAGIEAQCIMECKMLEHGGLGDYGLVVSIFEANDIDPDGAQAREMRDAAHQQARGILVLHLHKLEKIALELASSGHLSSERMSVLLGISPSP